jgi:hypothetical protein
LTKDFLRTTSPALTSIVTETHFQPDDRDPQGRMGRLIAFLADMAAGFPSVSGTPHGIAASNSTAVDIDQNGNATIVAAPGAPVPWAYFVTAPNTVPLVGVNIPLNWQGISVIRVAAGGTFNLGNWTTVAGKNYKINVNNGLLAVEGNNDFY